MPERFHAKGLVAPRFTGRGHLGRHFGIAPRRFELADALGGRFLGVYHRVAKQVFLL